MSGVFSPFDLDLRITEEPYNKVDALLSKLKEDNYSNLAFSSQLTQAYVYATFPTSEHNNTDWPAARNCANEALHNASTDCEKLIALATIIKIIQIQPEGNLDANQHLQIIQQLNISSKETSRIYKTAGYMYLKFHPEDYEKAAKMYAKACVLDPTSGQAWFGLGLAFGRSRRYWQSGDMQVIEPLALYQAGEIYNWENPVLIADLIRWLCEQNSVQQNMIYIRRAIEYAQNLSDYKAVEGAFLKLMLQALNRAKYILIKSPGHFQQDLNWVKHKYNQCLERALVVNPNDTTILYKNAQKKKRSGNLQEALELVNMCISKSRGFYTQAEILKVEIEAELHNLTVDDKINLLQALLDRVELDSRATERIQQNIFDILAYQA